MVNQSVLTNNPYPQNLLDISDMSMPGSAAGKRINESLYENNNRSFL